jgi:DNA-binding GntR family transcriptional regulator
MMVGMAHRIVRLPGIERIDLPTARQSVPPLHAYLRACILDGRLPPGTKLSQATLADQLGVSRTPLREVLRMLQEEGLITSEPNQRMRVTGLDPAELDSSYAARILLGALAVTLTIDAFDGARLREAQRLLTLMRRTARRKDLETWLEVHRDYHELLEAGAPEPLRRQLESLADRSVRYIRIQQHAEPARWADVGDVEHPAILQAVVDRDVPAATTALARHLAGTALRVLSCSAPDYVPTAVPRAVALVAHEGSAAPATPAAPGTPAAEVGT